MGFRRDNKRRRFSSSNIQRTDSRKRPRNNQQRKHTVYNTNLNLDGEESVAVAAHKPPGVEVVAGSMAGLGESLAVVVGIGVAVSNEGCKPAQVPPVRNSPGVST
ncbi:hypothetical protein M413DRAFT_443024 [Hebeloma cylindrosporum]|uniref:Uncharacterized protein n=1 Tax=Hebeloma cylindrosporum TaxID=76867 RepID=A0A0C3CJL4_HEBCY|nr:hypothetical protein M413DRAFT_443024 [Hebeloma cylindrosporum h7]